MGDDGRAEAAEVRDRILAVLAHGPAPPDAVAEAAGLEEHELIAEVGWLVFAGQVKTDRAAPRRSDSRFPFGPLTLTAGRR